MSKRRSPALPLSFTRGIAPTPERAEHAGGVVNEPIAERNDGRIYTRRYRAACENALDIYRLHGSIGELEYEVGQRFAREYARCVLGVRMSEQGSSSFSDYEMRAISAINGSRLLKLAFEALTPPRRSVVVDVCVDAKAAGSSQRLRSLNLSLQIIAKEWKML